MKTYAEAVERSMSAPTVVLFTSPTCAPCKAMKPVLAQLADKLDFPYAEVSVFDEKDAAMQLGVRAVPTLVILQDGHLQFAQSGFMPEKVVRTALDTYHVTQSQLDL